MSVVVHSEESLLKGAYYADKASEIPTENDSNLGRIQSSQKSSILQRIEGGTFSNAVFTLIAASVGTTLLMIPNAVAASGDVWALIQMIYCCLICYYSLVILIRCADKVNAKSYQELAMKTHGNWLRQSANLSCFLANWGSAILYLELAIELLTSTATIFAGDSLPHWLIDPKSKVLPVLVSTIFVLPLCITKELKALNKFLIVNTCFLVLFCGVVVYEGFEYQPVVTSFKSVKLFTWAGISQTFPTAVFGFTSHTNVLDVFIELESRSVKLMKKAIIYTLVFVFTVFVVVGIIGYASFSNNIDVLNNTASGVILVAYGFDLNGMQIEYPTIVLITMVTMAFSILMMQPFNIRPAKESLQSCITSFFKKEKRYNEKESFLKRFSYVFVTLYSGVLVAIFADNIETLLDLLGSTFLSPFCFIFPSLFYLKIFKHRMSLIEKIFNWFMIISIGIFTVWDTYLTLS